MLYSWKIYIALAGSTLLFLSGWHLHSWYDGYKAEKAEATLLQERIGQEEALAKIATEVSKTLTNDRVKKASIDKKAEVQIAKSPTSYGCKLPPNGVRLYREAIAATAITR